MSYALSQSFKNTPADNRLRQTDDYHENKAIPEVLKNKIARQVNNDSLRLILKIMGQTNMPVHIEAQVSGDVINWSESEAYLPLWNRERGNCWVVTHPSICGEDYTLEMFDFEGYQMCKLWSDYENKHCWDNLLNTLTLEGIN